MTLSRLIELAIIADLNRDSRIAEFPILIHDNPGAKAGDNPSSGTPSKLVTTVSVKEGGEIFGTGIKKMAVAVEIRSSLAADPNVGSLLDAIEAAVSARLQPSYTAPLNVGVTGREAEFSGPQHKVFGITAEGVSRTENNLERVRVVNRTFIATLI
jgi:hypothetical protein